MNKEVSSAQHYAGVAQNMAYDTIHDVGTSTVDVAASAFAKAVFCGTFIGIAVVGESVIKVQNKLVDVIPEKYEDFAPKKWHV